MSDRIEALTEILPYVREFLGQTFVIKLGGEVCQPEVLNRIAEQVSLIHHMGIRVTLVHGGGPQIDDLLSRLAIEQRKIAGRRITDEQTLSAAKMVYNGLLSADIVAALRRHGAAAVGLSGADAGLITATRRPPRQMEDAHGRSIEVDFGHVGDIAAISTRVVDLLTGDRMIPVVCSLAADESGNVLNVNADTIAARIAVALKAHKLIVMTNVPGVLRQREDHASLISYTDTESLRMLIREGAITDGMLPKVESCIEAVRQGVPRTHIIDGNRPGALLLELFLNEGCGTMIVNDAERRQYEEEMGR